MFVGYAANAAWILIIVADYSLQVLRRFCAYCVLSDAMGLVIVATGAAVAVTDVIFTWLSSPESTSVESSGPR